MSVDALNNTIADLSTKVDTLLAAKDAEVAADIAAAVAQATANTVPQSDVDASTAALAQVTAKVVAATPVTPAPAVTPAA